MLTGGPRNISFLSVVLFDDAIPPPPDVAGMPLDPVELAVAEELLSLSLLAFSVFCCDGRKGFLLLVGMVWML